VTKYHLLWYLLMVALVVTLLLIVNVILTSYGS
jgi:hypothetical protein